MTDQRRGQQHDNRTESERKTAGKPDRDREEDSRIAGQSQRGGQQDSRTESERRTAAGQSQRGGQQDSRTEAEKRTAGKQDNIREEDSRIAGQNPRRR